MVDLHNYSSASGTKNKLHNWEVLNRYGIEHTPGGLRKPASSDVL